MLISLFNGIKCNLLKINVIERLDINESTRIILKLN